MTATALTGQMTEAQLLEAFALTDEQLDAARAAGDSDKAQDITTVRGWLLDAIEDCMGADRFEAWLDGEAVAS